MPKRWLVEDESPVFETPIMRLHARKCRLEDEGSQTLERASGADPKRHTFYVLRSPDWCNVIPVTREGKVVLIRQQRIGIDEVTLEIPGGVVDPQDADPRVTALRELAEETGYEPLPGARCELLGWTHSNPAIFDNRVYSYLVGPVARVRAQALDPAEEIAVEEVAIGEIPRLIREGLISHSLILNTLYRAASRSASFERSLVEELAGFARGG